MTRLTFALASFVLCLAATPLVRLLAQKRGWIDKPKADRWHERPTALMGGIAIFIGFALPVFYATKFSISGLLSKNILEGGLAPTYNSAHMAGTVLLVGALFVFLLGFLDDRISIKPQTKLLGQILVASFVAYYGYRLHWMASPTLDTLLTIVWVVGLTNAMNLLDNMDGLSAGIGFIASFFLGVLLGGTYPHLALYAFCLSGALAAFLVYNFNPASIFMGDCGSLVIGFSLSFLSLLYSGYAAPTGGEFSRVAATVLIMTVPIFDTTLVTFIRTLSGRRASVGGKDHTSHRLVLIGMSERRAVLFLYGVAVLSGLAAWFVNESDSLGTPTVLVPMGVAVILFGAYLAQIRVYPEKEFSVLRDKTFTPILMELTYKRQILLVCLDFLLISFAYYLAYRLRFSGEEFPFYFDVFLESLPAVIACKLLAYFVVGVYRGIWSFLSFNDIWVYLKASFLGTVLSVAAVTFIYRFQDFSKGLFVIDWFLATGFLLATRGSFRLFLDTLSRGGLTGDTVLIYGAGRGGEILLREILNNRALKLKPSAFLDDDPLKAGKRLQGYTVYRAGDLARIVEEKKASGIVVSFREAPAERLDELKRFCKSRGLFLKTFDIHLADVDLEALP